MKRPLTIGDGFRFGVGLFLASMLVAIVVFLCTAIISSPGISDFGDWMVPKKSTQQER